MSTRLTIGFVAVLVLIVLGAIPVALPEQRAANDSLVITHVTVIDATGAPPAADMTVVIEAGRITAIGKSPELPTRSGGRIVDASGSFLIPGLWDMHVHAFEGTRPEAMLEAFIANGILGIRDMGCPPDRVEQLPERRKLGPRIIAAGPIIDGPRPMFPDLSIAVADELQARQAIGWVVAHGADFVKVYGLLPRDAYFAVADECRLRGISFAGHVPDSVSAVEASDAGQKSIEHLSGVWLGCSSIEEVLRKELLEARAKDDPSLVYRSLRSLQARGAQTYSKSKADELFARFLRNGTWQVPTLVVTRGITSVDEPAITTFLRLERDSLRKIGALAGGNRADLADLTAEDLIFARTSPERLFSLVQAMRAAGVEFMAGTDAPNPFTPPGQSLHNELELLVKAGFTPMEALQAATIKPAQYLAMQDQLGTVEAGKIADLVLLDANPLDDIRNTRRIVAVVVRGRLIFAAQLQRMSARSANAIGTQND